jgi:ribose transport system substrate-binding protein
MMKAAARSVMANNHFVRPTLRRVGSDGRAEIWRVRRRAGAAASASARRGFAVILLAMACFSCARQDKKIIAVVPKGNAQMYWQSLHAGANKAGREDGAEIVWSGPPSETDYNGQLQIVDAMINRRVDAIVLAPIDRKVLVSVVERAAREKIPVVITDSGIDTTQYAARVATDNFHAGEIAAERVGQILSGKGSVAMVMVQPGGASTMAREEGFEKKLAAAYPGVRIVARQYGWADFTKSLNAAENILTAHPDLDAIFASNESSTVGAAQAIKARGSKVKLVGFDFSPMLLEDLKSGVIDSLVVQDPFRMGYESVKAAVAAIQGKPVRKEQDMPPRLIDRNSLSQPDVQAQLNPDVKKYLD